MNVIKRLSTGHYEVSDGKEIVGSVFLYDVGMASKVWGYWHQPTDYRTKVGFAKKQGAIDALVARHLRYSARGGQ